MARVVVAPAVGAAAGGQGLQWLVLDPVPPRGAALARAADMTAALVVATWAWAAWAAAAWVAAAWAVVTCIQVVWMLPR